MCWALWLLLALCSFTAMQAPAAIPELTRQETLTLARDVSYLSETQAVLTFEEARQLDFPGLTTGSANFGWTNLTFWLRTELIKKNEQTYILEIGYPLLDELDIYIERDGSLVAHHVLGDQQAGTRRLKNATKPAFKFPQEPGHYRLTLRVRSSSSVQVPMTLLEETNYHNKRLEDFSYLFGYFGAVAIMIIYNFFIYLKTRSWAYFYYVSFICLFLALQVSVNGFGQLYLWPESWSNLIIGHFSYLLDFFVYQFTRSFLDLRKRPTFEKGMKVMAFVSVAGFFASLLLPYGLSVRIMALLTLATAVVLIAVAIIVTFIDRTHEGKFYLIAWGSLLVGCVIYLAKQMGWLPYNQWTHNAFMIGNIAEVTLLSFALADRFNRLQKQARESQKARAEAEAELSLSLKTRVYLVSDMAHRMNNPLNYISTSHANLTKEVQDLRVDINHIIEVWRPRDNPEQYEVAHQHINGCFETLNQSIAMMDEGIRRSASSVVAIRQLSGVDGYQLDRLHIHELLQLSQQRIVESAGKTALARLFIISDLAQAEVYTNRFAIPMVIELIFRDWLQASHASENFKVQLTTHTGGKPTLVMRMTYGNLDQARNIVEQVLPFLNQILRPYESLILCAQEGLFLELTLVFSKEKSVLMLQEVA
jgi:signal transduction histidine kinase